MFLNPLYFAVDEIFPDAEKLADPARLERTKEADFVDYPAVAQIKLEVLRRIYEGSGDSTEFNAFVKQGAVKLHRHAVFEALSHAMVNAGAGAGWSQWPEKFRRVTPKRCRTSQRNPQPTSDFTCGCSGRRTANLKLLGRGHVLRG